MTKSSIAFLFIFALLGIAYLIWLDQGCALNGIMTSHGKVCIN